MLEVADPGYVIEVITAGVVAARIPHWRICMALSIIDWQEGSERLTGDHFPRISDLLTLGGKVCCETKDIHLAAHGRANTNEVEATEVESNAHLHGLNTGIAQQVI